VFGEYYTNQQQHGINFSFSLDDLSALDEVEVISGAGSWSCLFD
jgi:hypothetical protein